MRAAWLILVKDLRTQIRNGSILVLGFAAPLGLAFVLNLVFGGLGDPDAPVTFDVGIVDLDGRESASGFTAVVDRIAATGLLDLRAYDDQASARAAVDKGDVSAAWVIPAGFSAAVESGQAVELVVIGDVDSPNTTSFAQAVASRYATGVRTSTLAALVAVETGVASLAEAGAVAEEVAAAGPLLALASVDADDAPLDATTRLTGGLILFFVFFAAGLPIISILEERSNGTLSRLLVAPISTASITAGKVLAAILLGVVSLASLMVASSVLMGADWGPAGGALLLATAAVLAAAGIMSVAGALARTTEQAGNVQSIVAVVLAMLGGAFVPIPGSESGLLGTIRGLTPHGWFLDGIADLRADGIAAAAPAIATLTAMGLVTGAIGLWLARRVLRR